MRELTAGYMIYYNKEETRSDREKYPETDVQNIVDRRKCNGVKCRKERMEIIAARKMRSVMNEKINKEGIDLENADRQKRSAPLSGAWKT